MKLEAQHFESVGENPQLHFLGDLHKQFRRRRRYELSSCAVGLLGILLMLVENEVIQRSEEKAINSGPMVLILKSCVLASTVLLDVLLLLRCRCDAQVHQLQFAVPSRRAKYSLWRPVLLLLELLVCSFHIPPGVGGEVEISQLYGAPRVRNDSVCESEQRGISAVKRGDLCYLVYHYPVEVFGVFMILRLYLLARFVRSSSALYSPWISLVGSLNGVDTMHPFFHFKAIFKVHPLNILLPLVMLITLLTAAIVRILERPVQAAFDNYWQSVWFTIVTLSGTGLGDYFPVTFLGRTFSVVGGMFCGVLIVALVQSLFFNFLDLTPNEKKVRYLIEIETWEKATHRNAARFIQAAWRARLLQRGEPSADLSQIFARIREARRLRFQKPTIELSVEDQVAEMETAVAAEVNRLETQKVLMLRRIQSKMERLSVLKEKLEMTAQAN